MVAYSFKSRFADDIVEGRKCQTIRGNRKRHARPGEAVQLFFGMRTKHCRKLVSPDPVCLSVEPVTIWVPAYGTAAVTMAGTTDHVSREFARADGFDSPEDFTRFWLDTHGAGEFQGVLIKWAAAPIATQALATGAASKDQEG